MSEKDESNEKILIDDEEKAKQEFLEELRNKNLEETIQLKKIQEAINQKLKEKEDEKKRKEEEQERKEEEQKRMEEAEAIEKANAEAEDARAEAQTTSTEDEDASTKSEEIKADEAESEDKGSEIVKSEEPVLAVTSEAKASLLNMEKKKSSFSLKILTATVVDTIVIAVISAIAVLLFNALLRLFTGYYVVDYEGVYMITFFIVMILYPVLMQTSKYKKTLGQKFSKICIKEGEE
ncbi:RDD family protein [Clostridium sp. JN-1]|uniref:RDD family protein n=1 Tax=Clostridium sp. JN-1 TaxID=2483110 RepID=UPI000F0B7E27|nr:RDD family protein [Clostridium sp. JN-1]